MHLDAGNAVEPLNPLHLELVLNSHEPRKALGEGFQVADVDLVQTTKDHLTDLP